MTRVTYSLTSARAVRLVAGREISTRLALQGVPHHHAGHGGRGGRLHPGAEAGRRRVGHHGRAAPRRPRPVRSRSTSVASAVGEQVDTDHGATRRPASSRSATGSSTRSSPAHRTTSRSWCARTCRQTCATRSPCWSRQIALNQELDRGRRPTRPRWPPPWTRRRSARPRWSRPVSTRRSGWCSASSSASSSTSRCMIYGQYVAQGVVEEKSSRVVELLLTTIRPWQLHAGQGGRHRRWSASASCSWSPRSAWRPASPPTR